VGLIGRLFRSRHVHDEVGSWFKEHMDRGRVLDLPAGDGVNSRGMAAAGFEVVAGDIFPEKVEGDGFTVEKVDLNDPLPFADGHFDGILFSEGIEHLDAQLECLAEMARVLKPGGMLIVTTPNVLHLVGRLSFLLTGHAHRNRSPVTAPAQYWGCSTSSPRTSRDVYLGHIFLINAFQLRFYLEHVGFEVIGVDTAKYSLGSVLLAPLIYPFVCFATSRLLGNKRKAKLPKDVKKSYMSQILSPHLLFGKRLIMVARKLEEPGK